MSVVCVSLFYVLVRPETCLMSCGREKKKEKGWLNIWICRLGPETGRVTLHVDTEPLLRYIILCTHVHIQTYTHTHNRQLRSSDTPGKTRFIQIDGVLFMSSVCYYSLSVLSIDINVVCQFLPFFLTFFSHLFFSLSLSFSFLLICTFVCVCVARQMVQYNYNGMTQTIKGGLEPFFSRTVCRMCKSTLRESPFEAWVMMALAS